MEMGVVGTCRRKEEVEMEMEGVGTCKRKVEEVMVKVAVVIYNNKEVMIRGVEEGEKVDSETRGMEEVGMGKVVVVICKCKVVVEETCKRKVVVVEKHKCKARGQLPHW